AMCAIRRRILLPRFATSATPRNSRSNRGCARRSDGTARHPFTPGRRAKRLWYHLLQERSCPVGDWPPKIDPTVNRLGVLLDFVAPVCKLRRFLPPWRSLKARGGFPPVVSGVKYGG